MWPDKNTIAMLYGWGAVVAPTTMEWYTENGFITEFDYKEITGKDYAAPAKE
ncbi:hypothetical protein RIN67_03175 [Levilactobacillus namurensis]|uniref:hypothetical protein n=1 Tax=Levilactobacillus namurensis TaxID=380393 RepID=UPI0028BA70A9|nr:hypothetical protein [Levilactobacillus namurensis]MDT7019288.1 hypothetical protein [Levilactobacillus namurensis]WNN66111.1 hypothetical protein RIN67_03175 [Levilactobacillus namurensis]